MRVSLINNRYFMVSGATRYLLNIEQLLRDAGHVTIPFSNRYGETISNDYEKYFVNPPGGVDAPFFEDAELTLGRALALTVRGAYSLKVRAAFSRQLRECKPDLCYSINICNYIGPSVIDAAKANGTPFVMRLSDFNLLCPAYSFYRDGGPCEDCRSGLTAAVKHRCLKDSRAVSLARVGAMWVHRLIGIYHRVTRYVTPSEFMRKKLIEYGYDADRIDHIPSFVDLENHLPSNEDPLPEIAVIGRLQPQKGQETVIKAAALLPATSKLRFILYGKGDETYVNRLRTLAADCAPERIEFAGFLKPDELRDRVSRSLAVAAPVNWYENMPNAITESMALGKAVVASDIGSLPEQIEPGRTGLLIPSGDPEALVEAVLRLEGDRVAARKMGEEARRKAELEYGAETHMKRLMRTFEKARTACG